MMRRSGFGWLEFIVGIILIILGIAVLIHPIGAMDGFMMICGAVAIIMGIADIIMYIRVEHFTGLGPMVSLVSGILSVMAGIMLIAYPRAGALVLGVLFPLWFIAHCISRLSRLYGIRSWTWPGAYYCAVTLNVIGVVLGVMLIVHPWLAIASVSWIVGLYLILLGIESLMVACSDVCSRY